MQAEGIGEAQRGEDQGERPEAAPGGRQGHDGLRFAAQHAGVTPRGHGRQWGAHGPIRRATTTLRHPPRLTAPLPGPYRCPPSPGPDRKGPPAVRDAPTTGRRGRIPLSETVP
ncbi:hypothetical protein GCM10011504_35050 [Siccirubricoccus deserti]|nr:hypothetical protein GCM10011504_35050 [Siccirubricoccus deserti]